MKRTVKLLILILVFVMLLSEIGCSTGSKKTDGNEMRNEDVDEEYVKTLTGVQKMMYERSLVRDEVPELDFNGRVFGMMAGEGNKTQWRPEELTSDQVDVALYYMNQYTEDRLNVKIDYNDKDNAWIAMDLVAMGDDYYSVVNSSYLTIGAFATGGYLYDFETVPYLNLDSPWYNQTAREAISVKGKSFLMVGAANIAEVKCTYCVYFNKRLRDEYLSVLPDFYQLVYDGKWTMDEFITLSRVGYVDLNGNQRSDPHDQFGLAAQTSSYAVPFLYSCGEKTVSRDENDIPHIDVNMEKTQSIVEKTYELIFGSPNVWPTYDWSTHQEIFTEGRCLFMYSQFWACLEGFREMDDPFGILPYPKYDEYQQDYHTCTDPSGSTLGLLITCPDRELAGAALEVLNWRAWQSVQPALYESALKGRAADEENDANMLDIINRGVVYDFGYVFGGPGELLSKMMTHKTNNFASEYRSRIKNWEHNINDAVDAILSNDR